MRNRTLFGALTLALLISTFGAINGATAAEEELCSGGPAAGGEWSSYGQDPTNARRQDAETTIGTANVATLETEWLFVAQDEDDGSPEAQLRARLGRDKHGAFRSTAAVADGCVFAGTSDGTMYAVDAVTGEVVWSAWHPTPAGYAHGIYGPAVSDGVVYFSVAMSKAPYVVALDQHTGEEIWRHHLVYGMGEGDEARAGIVASAVVIKRHGCSDTSVCGMLFVPVTGQAFNSLSRPSYYLLDASDGSVIKKTVVIPHDEWYQVDTDDVEFDPNDPGLPRRNPVKTYAGGSIWGTAAQDVANGYLYVGTANPQNKTNEHHYTNALIKIDVDPTRTETFGEIVDDYKGDVDYDPEKIDTVECQYLGEAQVTHLPGPGILCGQRDIDFGASPNLFTNADGRQIVGALQKSCTYHAAFADTMEPAWKAENLSKQRESNNGCAATTAYDANNVYVNANRGWLYALDKHDGTIKWSTQYSGSTGQLAQPVTVTNGVVYVLVSNGRLLGVDAETGTILLQKPIGPECAQTQGGSVSIAYNTVYVECDHQRRDLDIGLGNGTPAGAAFAGSLWAFRLPEA